MPFWLLKIQASSFINNEFIGGLKWPELIREKDGTAVQHRRCTSKSHPPKVKKTNEFNGSLTKTYVNKNVNLHGFTTKNLMS